MSISCCDMGNQPSHGQQGLAASSGAAGGTATAAFTLEPLEAFSKEKQRDDHLKNLGFKRSKSIRKSIAKRLKRKKKPEKEKQGSTEDMRDGASKASKASETSLETRVDLVDRPVGLDKNDRPLVGQPQPLPSSVQVITPLNGLPCLPPPP